MTMRRRGPRRPLRLPWYAHDRVMRLIVLLGFAAGLASGLVIPFITLTAHDRGVSLEAIGVMAASYLIAQMLLQLPMGALSDRFGRVAPIALGLLIEGAATGGFVLAHGAVSFILLRALQGIGVAAVYPSFRALVADATPPERRGQAFAVANAGFIAGLLFGPLIGGVAANLITVNALYLTAAAGEALLALSVALWMHRVGLPPRPQAHDEPVPLTDLLSRPLAGAFLLSFAGQFQFGLFAGIWSIYLKDLHASDLQLGLSFSAFSIAFVLMAPFGGRLADRRPRWRVLLFANLIYAVVVAAYGLVPNVPAILGLGLMEGVVCAVSQPTADAYLASVADPRTMGRAQGAFATVGMAGAAISAFLGPVLYAGDHLYPFLVGGVVLAVFAMAGVAFVRWTERRGQGTAVHLVSAFDSDRVGFEDVADH